MPLTGGDWKLFAAGLAIGGKWNQAEGGPPPDSSHYTEFGSVNGSGTLYFTRPYAVTPVYITRGDGVLSWLQDEKGRYIGLSIAGAGVTDIACYCSVPGGVSE